MSSEAKSLVSFPTEWNKKSKNDLLTLQKGASALGIFFAIVQTTNIFLIQSQANNTLTLWFGISTIFVFALNVLTLVWALRQTKRVRQAEDDAAEATDNIFTRALLFLQLVIFQLFAVYFLLFRFAPNDLTNQYSASHTDPKDQQSF
jgi:Ca2+/Na+ antiporter